MDNWRADPARDFLGGHCRYFAGEIFWEVIAEILLERFAGMSLLRVGMFCEFVAQIEII
jgi:hypothetical protein